MLSAVPVLTTLVHIELITTLSAEIHWAGSARNITLAFPIGVSRHGGDFRVVFYVHKDALVGGNGLGHVDSASVVVAA